MLSELLFTISDAIKNRYLGAERRKKRIRRQNDRKFIFDWENTDDTSADYNPIYSDRHYTQVSPPISTCKHFVIPTVYRQREMKQHGYTPIGLRSVFLFPCFVYSAASGPPRGRDSAPPHPPYRPSIGLGKIKGARNPVFISATTVLASHD
jgi:hypothetical protein